MEIQLNEQQLTQLINDTVNRLIQEGINVDANGNVTMTDKHEKLVDTSAENNPTVIKGFINDINVWSVFKRKDNDWGDGNPLLYALKGERGFKLKTPRKFFSRLEHVVTKFFENNSDIDITIAVPSNNKLNAIFAQTVAKHCKNPKYITNLFVKMTTEEVEFFVRQPDSAFRKAYGRFYEQRHEELIRYMRNMPYDSFQFHKVSNMQMRKTIEHTIKLADKLYGQYIEDINGKNILIIDDSLTLGQTIRQACSIIDTTYTPKTINVLTLFSPLYDAEGQQLKSN